MIRNYLFGLLVLIFLFGCGQSYRYNRRVEKELASGIRHDTLFMGIYLGMTDKDFYTHCWRLNKRGLIRQGTNNTSVLYKMKNFGETVNMNFYPDFYQGRIWKMPVRFNYDSWAPWNTNLYADSLLPKLVNYFETQYGKGFIKVKSKKAGEIFYKIDGNRQISVYAGNNDKDVWAIFTDLLVEREIASKTKNVNKTGKSGDSL